MTTAFELKYNLNQCEYQLRWLRFFHAHSCRFR